MPNEDDLFEVTLSLDTSAYADGDVLADTQEIANAFDTITNRAVLQSLVVLDEDDKGQALDIIFLRSNTSMGTENSAFSPDDADAEEILTIVEVIASDYVDLDKSQLAVKNGADAGMGVVLEPSSGTSLYVAAVDRTGGNTFTSAGIVLKVGLLR